MLNLLLLQGVLPGRMGSQTRINTFGALCQVELGALRRKSESKDSPEKERCEPIPKPKAKTPSKPACTLGTNLNFWGNLVAPEFILFLRPCSQIII
uniref:Uncharacterized protein n=1 Tax=Timema monikensis TaxID=170555 RepID=A0A7R9ECC0_9NEOP|nr:unnamed protein product [Timema monikensis]